MQINALKRHLKRGHVYRRADLMKWSNAVDRHIDMLVEEGTLQKIATGIYYFPKETAFGNTPPEEAILVKAFLKDHRFLLTSPNSYNALDVGITQLYNKRVVYNHKSMGSLP